MRKCLQQMLSAWCWGLYSCALILPEGYALEDLSIFEVMLGILGIHANEVQFDHAAKLSADCSNAVYPRFCNLMQNVAMGPSTGQKCQP